MLVLMTGCGQSEQRSTAPPPEPTVPWSTLSTRVQIVLQDGIAAAQAAPNDAGARLRLAQLYQGNALPAQAIEAYRQTVELDPESPRGWYGLGLLLADEGRIDEAIHAHAQVAVHAPEYAPARWQRGFLLLDQGRFEEAEAAFRTTLELQPRSPAARVGLARTALADGRPEDAETLLDSLRTETSSPYLDFLLGQAYRRQGRIEEAALLLANVQGDPPRYEDPWFTDVLDAGASPQSRIDRIDRLMDAGDLRAALKEARDALEDEPGELVLLNRLGHLQNVLGQQKAAMRTLKRALNIDEEYAPTHLNMSYQYQERGEHSKARVHAQRAVELNPNMPMAHMQVGMLLMMSEQFPTAVEHFDAAFRQGVQDTPARHQYAYALTRVGRLNDALKQYRIVLLLDRNDGRSWAGLADVFLLQNRLEEARQAVQQGLTRDPDSPNVQTMARVLQERLQSQTGGRP